MVLLSKINLYPRISKVEDDLTLILETPKKTLTKQLSSENAVFNNVDISPGKNIYLLKLVKDETVLDTKELILYANELQVSTYNDFMDFYLSKESSAEQLTAAALVPITGVAIKEIAYESSTQKTRKIAPVLLGLLVVFVVIAVLKKSDRGVVEI